jgi:hypothetical protein
VTERTTWTDPALDREFVRVYKQINGTPERMALQEQALKMLGGQVRDLVHEVEGLRKELHRANEVQPWTRGQRIAAAAVVFTVLVGIASMLVTILVATGGGS